MEIKIVKWNSSAAAESDILTQIRWKGKIVYFISGANPINIFTPYININKFVLERKYALISVGIYWGAHNRTSIPAARRAKIYLARPPPPSLLRLHQVPVVIMSKKVHTSYNKRDGFDIFGWISVTTLMNWNANLFL